MLFALRKLTRILYRLRGTGLPRIAELIRKLAGKYGPVKPLIINDFFGAKFYCHLREHMGGQIFFRGSYSGAQLDIVKKILPVDGVFLDLGANQGEFTVFAAQVARRGRVVSFEPVKMNLDRLFKNIKINRFTNVDIIPYALGEEDEELPLFDASDLFSDGTIHEGLHTLYPSDERGKNAGLTQVRRLDDLLSELALPKVDLIKMDIEGAELFALRGGIKTLEGYKPSIILEIDDSTCRSAGYQPEEIVVFLEELGYKLYLIAEGSEPIPLQSNGLREFQNVLAIHSTASQNIQCQGLMDEPTSTT